MSPPKIAAIGLCVCAALTLTATGSEASAAGPAGAGPARSSSSALAGGAGKDYILYAPLDNMNSHLVDRSNKVVHTWTSKYSPGQSAYLQDDGSLLRAGFPVNPRTEYWVSLASVSPTVRFGTGGIVERISAEDEVEWSFEYFGDNFMPHHDVERMPNGNILMIVWRARSQERAIAAGRDPENVTDTGLWLDSIVEVKPKGRSGGKVVWKWSAWDHLVQDESATLPNSGDPSKKPERIDINYESGSPDAMHSNSISYLEEYDQLILGVHNYSELWVIDHSTTTKQAKTSAGGQSGKGGDLLYRWGNPAAYGQDNAGIFTLSGPHDPNGLTENGTFVIFDNNVKFGSQTTGFDSELVEIKPPVSKRGRYELGKDGVFGPDQPLWRADLGFSEESLGTAERLPGGSTFSCDCSAGTALLVGADGATRWTQQLGDTPAFRILGYAADAPGVGATLVGLELKLAKRLDGSRLKARASCREVDCRARLQGTVEIGRSGASAAFRAIKPRRVELAAGTRRTLKLRLANAGRAHLRRALRDGLRVRVTLRGKATDSAGVTDKSTARTKLR